VIQLIDHNKTDMDNLLHPVTKEMSVNIVFVKKKKKHFTRRKKIQIVLSYVLIIHVIQFSRN